MALGPGISTVDMIFPLHQFQEKCQEKHMPLYHIQWPVKGIWSGQLQKIGFPPRLYKHYHILPWGYSQHGMLQWCTFGSLPCKQWSEARMCPSTDPLWDICLHASSVCFHRLYWEHLPQHQSWWQTIQHHSPVLHNKGNGGPHSWYAFCQWCSTYVPYWSWCATTGWS